MGSTITNYCSFSDLNHLKYLGPQFSHMLKERLHIDDRQGLFYPERLLEVLCYSTSCLGVVP